MRVSRRRWAKPLIEPGRNASLRVVPVAGTNGRHAPDCNGLQRHASRYSRRQIRDEPTRAEGSHECVLRIGVGLVNHQKKCRTMSISENPVRRSNTRPYEANSMEPSRENNG